MSVGVRKDILSFDARDEPSVARQALVANLVRGAVHPRLSVLRLITDHQVMLGEFPLVVDRGGPLSDFTRLQLKDRLADFGQIVARVLHFVSVLSSTVRCADGLPEELRFVGDKSCVARDVLSTIHFIILF